MREADAPKASTDLPQWAFISVLMALILLAAGLGSTKSASSAQAAKQGQEEKLTPLQLLQRRVDDGDPEAQRLMAIRFLGGEGVLRSAEESKKLYDLSVSGGNAQAMYELACLHDTGTPGFPRDAAVAWDLYFRAAKAGQIDAMGYVSEAFEGGPSKDLVTSYAWRSLAIHLHQLSDRRSDISFKVDGALRWMGIVAYDQVNYRNDPSYNDYTSGSTSLHVLRHENWLGRISRKLSDADILLAQKRSRELLAEIEAKKAKK
jgi:TPR repeat protein